MGSSSNSKSPDEKVHLERCKICGEWVNRLSLDDIVQHLDHSRRPDPQDDPAQSASLDERKRRIA